MHIATETVIAASAERVWSILTDLDRYGEWNPFILHAQGTIAVGNSLRVRIHPPGGRSMTFTPKLLVVEPSRELRWLGRVLFPGLLDGEHTFHIQRVDDGSVRFLQSERFSGVLVGLVNRLTRMEELTLAGFHAMNASLKARAEAN